MTKKDIESALSRLLSGNGSAQVNGYHHTAPSNRIFTNRNTKLNRILAIGFDMDFTLLQYNRLELDRTVFEMTLKKLVDQRGYPEGVLALPFDFNFAIRGLVIDTQLGNVLKLDKFNYVGIAYHGLSTLSPHDRREAYRVQKIYFREARFRAVDTLFELVETYLYSAVIDYFENVLKQEVDYRKLFDDIRGSVDACHAEGILKGEIMRTPERFVEEDPLLISTLHKFKRAGKRLFVVTNSEVEYSSAMLGYLFRHARPLFHDWKSCFDLAYMESKKPSFFSKSNEARLVDDEDCQVLAGGNINDLEARLGIAGDRILYVGDHIYGDILRSKRSSTWRTCMIVPELEGQIIAEDRARPLQDRLILLDTTHKKLDMKYSLCQSQINALHQFKDIEADELEPDHMETIDEKIKQLNREVEALDRNLSEVIYESRKLKEEISRLFNPYWGRLFQTKGQASIFAEQIRDYACIYTSAVSNFNFYATDSYFRSFSTPMPHESEFYEIMQRNETVRTNPCTKLEGPHFE